MGHPVGRWTNLCCTLKLPALAALLTRSLDSGRPMPLWCPSAPMTTPWLPSASAALWKTALTEVHTQSCQKLQEGFGIFNRKKNIFLSLSHPLIGQVLRWVFGKLPQHKGKQTESRPTIGWDTGSHVFRTHPQKLKLADSLFALLLFILFLSCCEAAKVLLFCCCAADTFYALGTLPGLKSFSVSL